MRTATTNSAKHKRRVVCRTCGGSPIDGVALFADGHDADGGPRRFCPQHLPLASVRARVERHLSGDKLIDPDVLEVFTARLAEVAS